MNHLSKILMFCFSLMISSTALGHHVLGRPAYSLNEDSNTPPSLAVETQLGDYYITYMVFPAFPKPGERGRLNLYATRIDNGKILDVAVSFSVRDDSWFGSSDSEDLGKQRLDDGVYRQGFEFNQQGSYLIRASFEQNGEPYQIDFPLQVGNVSPVGPIGATVAILLLILVGANLLQKKRIKRAKVQQQHHHQQEQEQAQESQT
ncbi:MAG: hypothetical protein ACI8WB_003594 [Phenylobacterium sp.]|jgi:hypothetical protein